METRPYILAYATNFKATAIPDPAHPQAISKSSSVPGTWSHVLFRDCSQITDSSKSALSTWAYDLAHATDVKAGAVSHSADLQAISQRSLSGSSTLSPSSICLQATDAKCTPNGARNEFSWP